MAGGAGGIFGGAGRTCGGPTVAELVLAAEAVDGTFFFRSKRVRNSAISSLLAP